jgi:hypothetical protein
MAARRHDESFLEFSRRHEIGELKALCAAGGK